MLRWKQGLLIIALVATGACQGKDPWLAAAEKDPAYAAHLAREKFQQDLRKHIVEDRPDPKADASARGRTGEFGLIVGGQHGQFTPPGVICFTPRRVAPGHLLAVRHGDVLHDDEATLLTYARAYNVAIVSRPDYPHADLCRPQFDADQLIDWGLPLVDRAARPVGRPPLDLHEAARRGGAADIRRFLKTADPDALDGVRMSALSWAVARDNQAAFDLLSEVGADPLTGGYGNGLGALHWAAVLGREKMFRRLLDRLSPEIETQYWGPGRIMPAQFMAAALASNRPAIVQAVRDRQYDKTRPVDLAHPLPNRDVLQLALSQGPPDLANRLLVEALKQGDRLDLVQLALANGANPNRVDDYESPLTIAAIANHQTSPDAVTLLIQAGADVNLAAHRRRPVWIAVRGMAPSPHDSGRRRRAREIFLKLVDAGADLNLPDWRGMPPIWALLVFPSASNEEVDESFATPEVLSLLAAKGMDVNATWRGRRILAHVEAQRGRDSEIARSLRAVGAK